MPRYYNPSTYSFEFGSGDIRQNSLLNNSAENIT